MKLFWLASLASTALAGLAQQQTPRVSAEDLRRPTGARRPGTLTCLDYRSNKRVSIPPNLTVTQAGGDETPEGGAEFFERNTYSWKR